MISDLGRSNYWGYSVFKNMVEDCIFFGVLVIFLCRTAYTVQSKHLVLYIFTMNWKSCEEEVYNTGVTK